MSKLVNFKVESELSDSFVKDYIEKVDIRTCLEGEEHGTILTQSQAIEQILKSTYVFISDGKKYPPINFL